MRLTKYLRECFVKAVFADIQEPVAPTLAQIQDALYENFHPLIKQVFDDEELRKNLNCAYYYNSGGCGGGYLKTGSQEYEDLPIYKANIEANKAYNNAMQGLRAVADGCTNLKQLQDTLPELVKYMVGEDKPAPFNLPAITGTVDALKALGWK